MIVVTAPTGQIGSRLLPQVLAGDQPVRVIVRDPATLPEEVRDRAEVVQGSHGDGQVVARAFAGADAVFWLLPTDGRAPSVDAAYAGFTRPAAEALRSSGVQRVVDVSALGRGTPVAAAAGYVTASLAMDDLLAGTGVALRSLTMPSFMDNVLRQAHVIREQGVFFDVLSPDLALPTVATRDIAAVAARLLLDGTWTGQAEVPVLGPQDLSYDDMAATMSAVLGFPVRYQQIPGEAFKGQLTGYGMSDAMAQGLLDMMLAKQNGLDTAVARTPQHAVDAPTTFRQWCEEVLQPALAPAAR